MMLCVDTMHVNKNPIIVSISRHIRFGTAEGIINQKAKMLTKSILKICKIYWQKGFHVMIALMDSQFKPIHDNLAAHNINLNVTARDEHVGDVEQYIPTIKEYTQSAYNKLLFDQIPLHMIIELAKNAVLWLNAFPVKNEIEENMSP